MSRPILKKDSSYSEFRRKNSLSKTSLHKSMLDIEQEQSFTVEDKTSQLLSLQNQLQSMVRNRSLSAKPSPKNYTGQSLKLVIQKKQQSVEDGQLHIVKRNSINCLANMQSCQKTTRSIQFQSFNEPFEIIQQSEIHNEEDNGMQQGNKMISAKGIKNEKSSINRRKNSNQLTGSSRLERKATITDLDQMQKRLESAKKKTKIELKDIVNQKKIVKKVELPTTKGVVGQKTQRRIHRTNSQVVMVTERMGYKGMELGYEKQGMTPKQMIKKKIPLSDSMKLPPSNPSTTNPTHNTTYIPDSKQSTINTTNTTTATKQLIPTKLVNSEQKQRLLKQLQMMKEQIKKGDISGQNMEGIRKMLKTMKGMIN